MSGQISNVKEGSRVLPTSCGCPQPTGEPRCAANCRANYRGARVRKLPAEGGSTAALPRHTAMAGQYHMAATYRRPERAKTMKEVALESQVAHGRKFAVRRHTQCFRTCRKQPKISTTNRRRRR